MCAADLKWGEAETMAMKKTCPASRAGVERDSIYFPRLRSPQNGARLQSGYGGERDVKQESTAADPSVVVKAVERLGSCFFNFIFLWLLRFQLLPRCCRTSWSSLPGWPQSISCLHLTFCLLTIQISTSCFVTSIILYFRPFFFASLYQCS